MGGVPGSTRKKPYAGPMYSPGTKEMDSHKNQGPVQGPDGTIAVPDPLGYDTKRNKGGKGK